MSIPRNKETLTDKEITEEKMRHELSDLGLYEQAMTYEHMEEVLKFVSESKCMAQLNKSKSDSDDFPSPPTALPDYTSFSKPANQRLPKQSFSYIRDYESQEIFDCKASNRSRDLATKEETAHRCVEEDSGKVSSVKTPNKRLSLKSASKDTNVRVPSQTEIWQMDPLQSHVYENDPVLPSRRITAVDCEPFSLCNHFAKSLQEQSDLFKLVNDHLDSLSKLMKEWGIHNCNQVDYERILSKVDANVSADMTDAESHRPTENEGSERKTSERASKRKATSRIAQDLSADVSDGSEGETESDSKITLGKRKRPDKPKSIETKADEAVDCFDCDDSLSSSRARKNAGNESLASLVYPRRIVPPNPSKIYGPRKRKKAKENSSSREIRDRLDGEADSSPERLGGARGRSDSSKSPVNEERQSSTRTRNRAPRNDTKRAGRSNVTRDKDELERRKRRETEERERVLLQDSDESRENDIEEDFSKKADCPICGKSFSVEKIENHASKCELYNARSEQTPSSEGRQFETIMDSSNLLTCAICTSFSTDNGADYEVHVQDCLDAKQDNERAGAI